MSVSMASLAHAVRQLDQDKGNTNWPIPVLLSRDGDGDHTSIEVSFSYFTEKNIFTALHKATKSGKLVERRAFTSALQRLHQLYTSRLQISCFPHFAQRKRNCTHATPRALFPDILPYPFAL
uniref:Uncharacterized protein n=1 Tax=Ixodes ricinus TaxID=34613 RepID=A0A6B0UN80_IXORI